MYDKVASVRLADLPFTYLLETYSEVIKMEITTWVKAKKRTAPQHSPL